MSENQTEKKKSPVVLIILLVAVTGLAGFFFYQNSQNEDKLADSEQLNANQKAEIDDLTGDLDAKVDEIDQLIAEKLQLGADVEDLELKKAELEYERDEYKEKALKAAGDVRRLTAIKNDLKKKNEQYALELASQKEEIADLVAAKDSLMGVSDSLTGMSENQKALIDGQNARLEYGSILEAQNAMVSYKNSKQKEYTKQPFKGKSIDMLVVKFNIGKNNTAPHNKKEIAIRLIGPDNETLYDENSGGGKLNTPAGESILYTLKQNLLFDNSKQEMVFPYMHQGAWAPGKYTVQIYGDGSDIGNAEFSVK